MDVWDAEGAFWRPYGAPQCERALLVDGEPQVCRGAVNTLYVRLGYRGQLTRVGKVCRRCGHVTWDTPPPLADAPAATAEDNRR